jgi:hypothetical protein
VSQGAAERQAPIERTASLILDDIGEHGEISSLKASKGRSAHVVVMGRKAGCERSRKGKIEGSSGRKGKYLPGKVPERGLLLVDWVSAATDTQAYHR